MPLFSFGKKSDVGKVLSLDQIPIFQTLSPSERKFVEKIARLVEFHKGDRVYSQGDQPDAFYVIISGRFHVLQKTSRGGYEKITNLYRGDHVGEISILNNQPHSVTVEAVNDALMLRFDREDFMKMLTEVPSLSLHVTRLLGKRLAQRDERRAAEHRQIVSMFNLRSGVGKTSFVTNLSAALKHELKREVIMLNMDLHGGEGIPRGSVSIQDIIVGNTGLVERYISHHAVGFDYMNLTQTKSQGEEMERRISFLLTYLVSRYHYVLVDLPREIQDIAYKVLAQSDVVYVLTDDETENLEKCRSFIKELKESFGLKEENIKLLLSDSGTDRKLTMKQRAHISGQRVFRQLPFVTGLKDAPSNPEQPFVLREPQSPYAKTVRFLARDLGNAVVGLALSSGAAFGLAHIGVLKVLEEENVPIDVISGSSIGSLMGAFWAAGMSADDMKKLALSFNPKNSFFRLVGFGDIMLPHWGIFKGNRIEKFLKSLLGNKTFEDLDIPLRVIATNLVTSEPEVFEDGDVVKAIRASCSIPGIFRAVRLGGKILVDGGIADPLPVGVLGNMGVKKIIAVNVLSGPKDHKERREIFHRRREVLRQKIMQKSAWNRFWYDMEHRFAQSQADNIFNVLMSTIQFMEYSIAAGSSIGADVVIHPVVIDSHWAEFYSAEKFIKVGEEKTREAMKEIRALLES